MHVSPRMRAPAQTLGRVGCVARLREEIEVAEREVEGDRLLHLDRHLVLLLRGQRARSGGGGRRWCVRAAAGSTLVSTELFCLMLMLPLPSSPDTENFTPSLLTAMVTGERQAGRA